MYISGLYTCTCTFSRHDINLQPGLLMNRVVVCQVLYIFFTCGSANMYNVKEV